MEGSICMAESSEISSQVIERAPSTQTEHYINAIAIDIIDKLSYVPPALSNTYICRVHHQLRMVNKKAYEPVLLSVGPYHYSKRASSLQYMEEHKLRYLNQVIERVESQKGIPKAQQLNNYLTALEELEDNARSYYEEAITLHQCDFLEMMLIDGCFIIEVFRRASTRCDFEEINHMGPLFEILWVQGILSRDLLLIENQLPFFILEKLHTMIWDEPNSSLLLIFNALEFLPTYSHLPQDSSEVDIALQSISNLSKKPFTSSPISAKSRALDPEKLKDIKHLLDLVRKFMLIEEILKYETNRGAEQEHKGRSKGSTDATNKLQLQLMKSTFSAIELSDLGVEFKGIEKGKFHDIKFNDGVLEIPIIEISDVTEVIFRNLIAYEEHAQGHGVRYIADYMTFMDGLVDSPKDVELLRRRGIINSFLGNDEVISTMFNKVNDHVIITREFCYKKIVHDLTKHFRKKRHVWMASLRRNYLNSPWKILSIIVASVLLILTAQQTAYTTLSYYQKE